MRNALVGLLALALVGVAPVMPPRDLMAHVRAFVAVTEGASSVNPDTLFTPDAVVIDEVPPFRWDGPHAASTWYAMLHGHLVAAHMRGFRVAIGAPLEYRQAGDGAYLIVPAALSGMVGTKPFHSTGSLTFTFRRIAGDWKIATDVWTTTK